MNNADLLPERSLGDYAGVLYRQRYTIALVVAAAIVASTLLSWVLPPRYEARSVFYIPADVSASRNENDRPALAMPTGDRDGARAQSSILKADEAIGQMHREFPEKSVSELRRDVDVVPERTSLISVYARDADPKRAADIANAFVALFDRMIAAATARDSDASIARAQAEIEQVQDKLSRTTGKVRELELRQSELPDIVAQIKTGRDEINALESYVKSLRSTVTRLRETQLLEREPAVVVQVATPPRIPIFPIPYINSLVAAVIGLVLGVLYAFVLDHITERRRLAMLRRIEEQEWNRLLAAEFPLPRIESRA